MSSSIYGVSSTSNRITGMMSGIDTDDFVKGATSGILGKITRLQQQRQLLQWKTSAYQGISSKMIDFNNTYMSYSSSLNALSSSFYNTRSVSSSSAAVSVSGYSASASNLSIQDIKQYAETASFVSTKEVAASKIAIKDIVFEGDKVVSNIAGETLNIEYKGASYKIKIADTPDVFTNNQDVVDAIAAALATVEVDDTTTLADVLNIGVGGSGIEFNANDPTESLKIVGGSGKLLEALSIDPTADNDNSGGTAITLDLDLMKHTTTLTFDGNAAEKQLYFTYNGTTRAITMPKYNSNNTQFLADLQKEFDKAFGANRVTVGIDGLTTSGTQTIGSLTFETNDPSSILTLSSADAAFVGEKSILDVLVGSSNRLVLTQAIDEMNFAGSTPLSADSDGLYRLKVNDIEFKFEAGTSLQAILDEINSSEANVRIEYLNTTNRFSITSTVSGASGGVKLEDVGTSNMVKMLFGSERTNPNDPSTGDYVITKGQDAIVEISYDGGRTTTSITRSSNSFDLDGLTLTLNPSQKHDFEHVYAADGTTIIETKNPITFEVKSNADDLVAKVMTLINAFNEINTLSNSEVNTRRDREYPPLTEEERADMSESQIALWEEKAMAGMLFSDPTLRAMNAELRFIFSFSVPGVGAISDFGITVSKNHLDYGKVVVDEEALRKAIEERPDDFAKLFTAPKADGAEHGTTEQGIMLRIKDVFDKYASTTGKDKGALITMAGIEGGSVLIGDTQLSKQLDDVDKQIKALEKSLKTAQDRYYRQFTSLEVYIAKMSAQSSWLMDMYS